MEIVVNELKRQSLEKFADEHNFAMVVIETPPHLVGPYEDQRYRAGLSGIRTPSAFPISWGWGSTAEKAIEAYKGELSNREIVLGVTGRIRKSQPRIQTPVLT